MGKLQLELGILVLVSLLVRGTEAAVFEELAGMNQHFRSLEEKNLGKPNCRQTGVGSKTCALGPVGQETQRAFKDLWVPSSGRLGVVRDGVQELLAGSLWPPGCTEWALDHRNPYLYSTNGRPAIKALTFSDISLYDRQLGQQASAFTHQWDAIQLGHAGLTLGPNWAIDFWLLNSYPMDKKPPFILLQGPTRVYGDNTPLWYLAVDSFPRKSILLYAVELSSGPVRTGIHLQDLPWHAWHRITIVGSPGEQVYYVNGTRMGSTKVVTLSSVFLVGNGGRRLMSPGGGLFDFRFCVSQDADVQVAVEERARSHARVILGQLVQMDLDWLPPLPVSPTRGVVVVENADDLLLRHASIGAAIDKFDVVIRFDSGHWVDSRGVITGGALPGGKGHGYPSLIPGLLAKSQARSLGTKLTHLFMNDFSHLCGCSDGNCCLPSQVARFIAELSDVAHNRAHGGNGHVYVIVVLPHGKPLPEAFKAIPEYTGVTVHLLSIGKHFEAAMNVWLEDKLSARWGSPTGGKDGAGVGDGKQVGELALPPYYSARTGFQVLAALLLHGITPTIAGFDRMEEGFGRYTAASTEHDYSRHLPEGRVIEELIIKGMIKQLT
eukprot:jgi/Mesvir1/3231/Mv16375-RA.1